MIKVPACMATILLSFALMIAPPALAQQLMSTVAGDNGQVEVLADDGIELRQDERLIVASGNARLLRGDFEMRADVLRARYADDGEATLRITHLRAEGNVKITSPEETAQGALGEYDVAQGVITLSGGGLSLETKSSLVTADGQLEYWEKKRMAVARGNATVTDNGRVLRADLLSAYFRPSGNQANRITRVEAFNNVRIETENEVVEASSGVYDANSSIVTLTGRVRLLRGGNRLDGCAASVNLTTGVSKLESCKNGGSRVRGILIPDTR